MSLARTIHIPFFAEPAVVSTLRSMLRRWSERRAERRRVRQARYELAHLNEYVLRDIAFVAQAHELPQSVPGGVLRVTPEDVRRDLQVKWMR
ncbi:hypothetical protein [Elioraea sp.]|uniref:hypothetical protein n=1 Tax=Elioraea sp. TaxID=2185103 RepID=UPI003F70B282